MGTPSRRRGSNGRPNNHVRRRTLGQRRNRTVPRQRRTKPRHHRQRRGKKEDDDWWTDDTVARYTGKKKNSPLPDLPDFLPRDCATSQYPRLIHGEDTWLHLQDLYYEDSLYPRSKTTTGFRYAVVVHDEGFRGRSVYAAEDIPADVEVWNPRHSAIFHTPYEWIAFLRRIDQHDLICDVLLWAYVEKGKGVVSLALDAASYTNHGGDPAKGETDENNLTAECYSTRQIHKGEELLENYSEFIGYHEVEWFDHIRGVAWQEPGVTEGVLVTDTTTYNVIGAPKPDATTGSYSQQRTAQLRTGSTTGGSHHQKDEATTTQFYQQLASYYDNTTTAPDPHGRMLTVVSPLVVLLVLCAYLLRHKGVFPWQRKDRKHNQ